MQGIIREFKPDIFKFKQTLILLGNSVLGADKNFYQRGLIEIIQDPHYRQAPDELGNQAELN